MTVGNQVKQTIAGLKVLRQALNNLHCKQKINRQNNCTPMLLHRHSKLLIPLNQDCRKSSKKNPNIKICKQ